MYKQNSWQITSFIVIVGLLFVSLTSACFASSDITLGPENINDNEFKKMERLNSLADQFYHHVKVGEIEEARAEIITLNESVMDIRFHGIVTPEGVEALLETVISAKHAISAMSLSKHELIVAASRLRFAVDALTHPNNPMWLQYYNRLKDDVHVLKQAVTEDDQVKTNKFLQDMTSHYDMIRPAVMITRGPAEVNKIDSYLKFLINEPHHITDGQFDIMLNELFQRKTSTTSIEFEPQPYSSMLWTVIFAGIILSVLGYVAWRKYEVI